MNNSLYSSEYSTALAIVGMAGRFPGASSLEQFWQNIASKVSSVRHYTDEELLAAGVKPEDLQQPNYVKAGAVLENIEYFDTSFFGFSPREAELLDPQFRIFLECVWEVLEMAGYDLTTFEGLIGAFAGAGYKNYQLHHINKTPGLQEEISEFQMSLGQETDVLATMISYKLNLKGPSVSVQSFCSTSLVAVHLACQSLLNYECDMAIAGGVALNSLQMKGYFYEEGRIVSPDGLCRPFDARTQGSVLSNGAAVVGLKRLRDALKDGDQIHAIIRGSAMNNDGNQRVSYTAPGLDGQASVIASAMSYAGVHPETISYIEANGTGTRLGDAIELAALIKSFSGKTRQERFCAIGSLKPNIGHLDRASGVAGLIKTTLALSHQQLPPQLYYEQPNPEVDLRHSPFYVNTNLAPWPRKQTPRRAGINSFGLGGTNVHMVLEEAPEREPGSPSRTWQLLPLSARSAEALQQARSNLATQLKAHPEQALADIAYTLQVGRSAFSHRQFVVAQTTEEAGTLLEQPPVFSSNQEHRDSKVAFYFPGIGKHSLTLAQNLYRQEPHFREIVVKCCQFLQTHLHLDLQKLFTPELETHGASATPPETRREHAQDSDRSQLEQPEMMQPAIFIIEYALAHLLMEWHIHPQALYGSGSSEYVAACLAGVLSLEDALTIVARSARLKAKQEDASTSLRSLLHSITWQEPLIPYISNVTGTWITKEQATRADYWTQQMQHQPGDPGQAVELLLQVSVRVVLAVGTDAVSEQPSRMLPLTAQRYDQGDLLQTLGRLWLAGVTIDWKRLFAGEHRLRVALPTYPFERHRCWIDDPANLNVIRQRKKLDDLADWFYVPYWEPAMPPAFPRQMPHQHTDNHILVFIDSSGIGTQVARRLKQEGCPVVLVEAGEAFAQRGDNHFALRPGTGTDYIALLKELSSHGQVPKHILHCWNLTKDTDVPALPADYLDPQRQIGFASLLCLVKAIGTELPETKIQLTVLSNHVQAVTGEESLHPEKAPILGLCKVIAQEYPHLTCQSIDLADLDVTSWSGHRCIENLAAECLVAPTDLSVTYRGYTRWAQKYSPIRLEDSENSPLRFRRRGVYLIIGGLGEVGLLLAEHLAAREQARIVLLDETSFPPDHQWSTWSLNHPQDTQVRQTIQRLQALEALGAEVWVLQANLADTIQMQQVIAQIYHRFEKLHGVIHLAGSSELQAIQDMDQVQYETHFRPKLAGLYALEQALQDTSLDFCLLFSSLTAILGGVGCTIEAAISTFTDTFVLKKSQTSSTPWISVNWDLWRTRENAQKFSGTAVATYMMSPEEALEALSRIVASQWIRMINSTGDLSKRLKQLEQTSSESAYHTKPVMADGIRSGVSTEYVAPGSPVEQKIVEMWQRLLGFKQIGIHDNFFELHGHSLLAMQLLSRLRQIFQVNIPLAKLFESPTVAELAEVVESLLLEEIEKLGEEEAQMLI